jgi:hypothetical protein
MGPDLPDPLPLLELYRFSMTATVDRKEKRTYSKRRRIIEAVVIIALSTLVIGTLSSIALLIYTQDTREPVVHTVEIDAGASELIASGENPLEIPSTWIFYADDTLILDNRDDVQHSLGNWVVPPNTIQAFDLQPAYGGFFVCSLHPSGAITLSIQPRDYDFRLIALPTIGFGIAVGIIIVISLNVTRALDDDEDEWIEAGVNGPNPDKVV